MFYIKVLIRPKHEIETSENLLFCAFSKKSTMSKVSREKSLRFSNSQNSSTQNIGTFNNKIREKVRITSWLDWPISLDTP